MEKKKNRRNLSSVRWNINNKDTASKKTSNVNESKNTTVVTTTTKGTNVGSESKWKHYSNSKNYDYKGKKNQTLYPEFIEICMPIQKKLKRLVENKLLDVGYTDVVVGDGYVYAKGTIPVLLTAHMDTVHKLPVIDFYEYYDEEKKQHIISSPQGIGGDDRCGIYMILEIIKTHKCSVLFCEDEETGGVGSDKFCKTELINELSDMKYLIEFDRKNATDAVFYDCDNDEFTKFIEKYTGYKEAYGSFSDISNLSPACKVASVNLSCGYYNAHSTSEYVIVEEMMNTIEVAKKLLDVECEQFEYIEMVSKWDYGYGNYGYRNYGNSYYKNSNKTHSANYDYNYDYGDYWEGYQEGYYDALNKRHGNEQEQEEEKSLLIMIYSEMKSDLISYVSNGKSTAEAFGNFFMKNPEYCFDDITDYEFYERKICNDGWLSY